MLGVRQEYRVQKFDIQNPGDVHSLEQVKQRVIIEKALGWAIISQTQTADKFGDMFVLLEWIQPIRE
jgi:hypothetical protein